MVHRDDSQAHHDRVPPHVSEDMLLEMFLDGVLELLLVWPVPVSCLPTRMMVQPQTAKLPGLWGRFLASGWTSSLWQHLYHAVLFGPQKPVLKGF